MFRTATEAERPTVLRFRKDVFIREHGYAPLDRLDDEAVHMIALESTGAIVSTARMLLPSQRPFELETLVDVESFLSPGSVLSMVGGFAIHAEFREVSKSIPIQIGIFKLTRMLAARYRITDIIMYTFPHLLKFYSSISFRSLGLSFFHEGYRREMHVMHLSLEQFDKDILSKHGRMSELFSEVRLI
jgi:predicted GNAT family N-acyltransferase